MAEENNKQLLEDEQKEVSSTQTNGDEETVSSKISQPPKERVITALPMTDVKPSASFKLSSFSGDDSEIKIINWIRMYENLALRSDWSEEAMKWNLPSYLEAKAFDFYIEQVLNKNLNWWQAKQLMVRRFDQYDLEPFMEFLSHKWTPRIELKEHFKMMRALGMEAGLKDEDILTRLSHNLPLNLRQELDFVTSLQQWVAVAFCLQQKLDENNPNYNQKSWKGRRGGRGNSNRSGGNLNKQRSNLMGDHLANSSSEHQIDV